MKIFIEFQDCFFIFNNIKDACEYFKLDIALFNYRFIEEIFYDESMIKFKFKSSKKML